MGSLKLKSNDRHSPAQDYDIESFISHEQYDPNTKQNDIALIKLKTLVDLSNSHRIRPACLWQSNKINQNSAIATGWGKTEYLGVPSNELMKVKLDLVESDECQFIIGVKNALITGSQICAGLSAKKDTCQGGKPNKASKNRELI